MDIAASKLDRIFVRLSFFRSSFIFVIRLIGFGFWVDVCFVDRVFVFIFVKWIFGI